jgi:N-acyl-D-amino-acid deacylase
MPADLVFRNATVIDGSGGPPFAGDVAIESDRITAVGSVGPGRRELDATGLVLCPGFVDTHSHDDAAFIRYPGMEFKVAQGVTSEVSGNCGFSAIPVATGEGIVGTTGDWQDLDGYAAAVAARKPAINNIMLIGHNTVRALAMDNEKRSATDSELARMRGWVEQAMEQGACGFSTGLIYEPGRYSDTGEVVALAAAAAAAGGVYATHMRNEGDQLLEAVEEALVVGREAGCPVHISHHKAAGRRNWGRVRESLDRVDRAIAEGQEVTLDVYPYTAGSGPMNQYFRLERIDLELAANIRIANCPDYREYEGRMLPELAESEGISLEDAVRRVVTGPRGLETVCIQFIIDEADIETNLRYPRMMVGSDGIPNLRGMPHPRLYGTFPRVLAVYVRERGVLTLEEAVRRMTSLPAERFGLAGRGRIAEGAFADLVLFDPAEVRDLATYDDPQREPAGVRMVMVNGQVAVDEGRHTGAGSGRVLRYGRES